MAFGMVVTGTSRRLSISFGTICQNFVRTRATHGPKQAFELAKAHFEVPER